MNMRPRLQLLRSRRVRIALGILAIALPATADAPRNPPQYAQFDKDAVVITDRFTTLVWERRIGSPSDQLTAKGYCLSTVFAPASGRLPTVKELLTLVDEDPHTEYDSNKVVQKSIDQLAFPDIRTDKAYWTSTPAGPGKFWTVEFESGKTEAKDGTTVLNVRCVR